MDHLPRGAPTLVTVLAGNKAMERRLPGPRGVPSFEWLATVRSHSIPILWRRALHIKTGITVARAKWSDLDHMCELWSKVAPTRQFAPVFCVRSLANWIRSAPGLDISSYLIARSARGELLGFMALWDQTSFKQMYVETYSGRMSIVVAMANAVAPIAGGARLADPGEKMKYQTALHVCVPGDKAEILGALLRSAHNDLRHSGTAFFTIGLDVVDPLSSATHGLFAQPTAVNAYLGTRGNASLDMAAFRRLPLHYEISLV